MKKLLSLLMAMVLSVSLVACGGGVDTQPAIDAFNSASDAFNKVANEINADIDAYPQMVIDVMNEMADALNEKYELLDGDADLTEEQVTELVTAFSQVETWATDTYADLDSLRIDLSMEAIIEAFNYISPRFDAISAIVNENIEAFSEEFIDGMIEVAEGLIGYKEVLESGAELTEEERLQILQDLALVDEWVTTQEASLAG